MLKQSAEENRTAPEQLRCNMDSLNAMVLPPRAPAAHLSCPQS